MMLSRLTPWQKSVQFAMMVDIVQNVPLHTGTRQRIKQKIRCKHEQGMRNCTKLSSVQNVHVTQPSYGKICLDFPVRRQPSLSDHIKKDTGCSGNLSNSLPKNMFETTPLGKGTARLACPATPKHTVVGGATKRIGQHCKIRDLKKTQTTRSLNTSPSSKVLSDIIRLGRHQTS